MDNEPDNKNILQLKSSEYAELVAADLFKNELGSAIEILFPLKRNFKGSDFFLYVNESKSPQIISAQVKYAKLFTGNQYNKRKNQLGNAVFQFKTNTAAELYCLIFYVPCQQNEEPFLKPQVLVMEKKDFEKTFRECKKNGGYRFSLAVDRKGADPILIEKTKEPLSKFLICNRKKELKNFIKNRRP